MNILIFGPQGSGKSTYGRYIAEKLNLTYLSSGDISREVSAQDSDLGKRVKDLIDHGFLIDDSLMEELLLVRLGEKRDGFLLDGFPRTLSQLRFLKEIGIQINLIVFISVDPDVSYQRLLKRGRAEDAPERIKTRQKLYHELTEPIIGEMSKSGTKVVNLSNDGDIEEVKVQIDDKLKELS